MKVTRYEIDVNETGLRLGIFSGLGILLAEENEKFENALSILEKPEDDLGDILFFFTERGVEEFEEIICEAKQVLEAKRMNNVIHKKEIYINRMDAIYEDEYQIAVPSYLIQKKYA